MSSLGMSAQITASFGRQAISSAISRTMERVHSVCLRAPDPPAEPTRRGMPLSRAPSIRAFRSFFAALRLTVAVPAPSLWGPASVLPASTTMASGFSSSALLNDPSGNP